MSDSASATSGRIPPLGENADVRNAILRWRIRWLRESFQPKARLATRTLPLLLQCSFEKTEFRSEAPGVEGMKPRGNWGTISRAAGLTPPLSFQRGRRMVEAVLALPGEKPLLWVLPKADLGLREAEVLKARVAACKSFLAPFGVSVEVLEAPFPPEILFWGGLVAGQLTDRFWEHLAPVEKAPANPLEFLRFLEAATTPLLLLLTLMLKRSQGLSLASVLSEEAGRGLPARRLADPEFLLLRWAQKSSAFSKEAQLSVSLAALREETRRQALLPEGKTSAEELLQSARKLWISARWATRSLPPEERKNIQERLSQESIEGIPSFFVKPLASGIAPPLSPPVQSSGALFEVRDHSGVVLGRAASPEQANIRALSLLRSIQGAPRVSLQGFWQKIQNKLSQRSPHRAAIAVTIPRPQITSPLEEVIWVLTRPGRRPSARRIKISHLLSTVLTEMARGGTVEVMIGSDDPDPSASRLDRTIVQTAAARRIGNEVALQDGERVLCVQEKGVNRIHIDRFMARPRNHTFISADPLASHPSVLGRRWKSPTIECQIVTHDAQRAGVEYLDGLGNHFRELVPLSHLDAYIRETQRLLREMPTPGLLAIRASAQVAAQVTRHTEPPTSAVEVAGRLPLGLQLKIQEDVFCTRGQGDWHAAASRILSEWPSGIQPRINFSNIMVQAPKDISYSLNVLYVRSVVTRRLNSYLKRLT